MIDPKVRTIYHLMLNKELYLYSSSCCDVIYLNDLGVVKEIFNQGLVSNTQNGIVNKSKIIEGILKELKND